MYNRQKAHKNGENHDEPPGNYPWLQIIPRFAGPMVGEQRQSDAGKQQRCGQDPVQHGGFEAFIDRLIAGRRSPHGESSPRNGDFLGIRKAPVLQQLIEKANIAEALKRRSTVACLWVLVRQAPQPR